MRAAVKGAATLFGAAALVLGAARAAPGQSRSDPRLENRMLRQATAQEARGNLGEAEATLRELLSLHPSSSAAVFGLERVFRAGGRVAEVLPVVDAYLGVDPEAGSIRGLGVKVLAETGAGEALEGAVAAWILAAPGSADPYREGAVAYVEVLGAGRAAELLEEGLVALNDPPVLLIELGDVHMAAGRVEDGADAWARALGRDRARNGEVFRRVADLGAERTFSAAVIVAALGDEPTTVPRLEAGAELALREDLEVEAQALAGAARERLDDPEARGFLKGFARKAEDLDRQGSALWAYRLLVELVDDPAEARSNDERLARAAMAVADTASALAARRRITESYGHGSPQRRSSWTEQLRIQVVAEDAETAMAALGAFRNEFPDAAELDELSAALASRLLGGGMREAALEVLNGIEGPGAGLERAFLLLEGGAVGEGIAALQAALPDLEPSHATEILELSLALGELTSTGARLAAHVAITGHRGHPEDGIDAVAAGIDAVPASDRPTILAMAARVADEVGHGEVATGFRRRIVVEHSDAREFPEAAVRLARAVATQPGGRDEAVRILEALIVGLPDSPVVPGARRELQRILASGPGEGAVG